MATLWIVWISVDRKSRHHTEQHELRITLHYQHTVKQPAGACNRRRVRLLQHGSMEGYWNAAGMIAHDQPKWSLIKSCIVFSTIWIFRLAISTALTKISVLSIIGSANLFFRIHEKQLFITYLTSYLSFVMTIIKNWIFSSFSFQHYYNFK